MHDNITRPSSFWRMRSMYERNVQGLIQSLGDVIPDIASDAMCHALVMAHTTKASHM